MLCPVCKVDMFVLEFELVEIDYCFRCRGVWLDSGELELIGERAGALQQDLLETIEEQKGERLKGKAKRRCPVCRKPLARVQTRGRPPVVLDKCPAQHGLWCDRGELQAVIREAGADESNVLVKFFHELERPAQQQGAVEEG